MGLECVRAQVCVYDGGNKGRAPPPYKPCHMLAVNIDELMEK